MSWKMQRLQLDLEGCSELFPKVYKSAFNSEKFYRKCSFSVLAAGKFNLKKCQDQYSRYKNVSNFSTQPILHIHDSSIMANPGLIAHNSVLSTSTASQLPQFRMAPDPPAEPRNGRSLFAALEMWQIVTWWPVAADSTSEGRINPTERPP